MPNVIIDGPFLQDIEIKRSLIKEITDALEKAYKLPRDVYIVLIKENKLENVGVGGNLIIDSQKK